MDDISGRRSDPGCARSVPGIPASRKRHLTVEGTATTASQRAAVARLRLPQVRDFIAESERDAPRVRWEPSKGSQTLPRWAPTGKARLRPTRSDGNPRRVPKPSRDGLRRAKPICAHAFSVIFCGLARAVAELSHGTARRPLRGQGPDRAAAAPALGRGARIAGGRAGGPGICPTARARADHADADLVRGVVGAVALIALAFAPRMARRPNARPQAATAAAPAPTAALPEAVAPATTAEPTEMSATEPGPVAAEGSRDGSEDASLAADEGCDTDLIRRAPWRLSREACARAFEAESSNAALALAIAHAEHAHGSPAKAAQWAKRALALDSNAAEAYVSIARAG